MQIGVYILQVAGVLDSKGFSLLRSYYAAVAHVPYVVPTLLSPTYTCSSYYGVVVPPARRAPSVIVVGAGRLFVIDRKSVV